MSQGSMIVEDNHADAFSRNIIDNALGVLLATPRCSQREAFNEIADAVRWTGILPGSLSGPLVALASGTPEAFNYRTEVAELCSELFADRCDTEELIRCGRGRG